VTRHFLLPLFSRHSQISIAAPPLILSWSRRGKHQQHPTLRTRARGNSRGEMRTADAPVRHPRLVMPRRFRPGGCRCHSCTYVLGNGSLLFFQLSSLMSLAGRGTLSVSTPSSSCQYRVVLVNTEYYLHLTPSNHCSILSSGGGGACISRESNGRYPLSSYIEIPASNLPLITKPPFLIGPFASPIRVRLISQPHPEFLDRFSLVAASFALLKSFIFQSSSASFPVVKNSPIGLLFL
jgi:hypothetical protein